MIIEIALDNFKCFPKKETFSFSKINLLTGINGRGKSTVFQSMLLLSQTFRAGNSPQRLIINGEWVELGTFNDIKNINTELKTITFDYKTDDTEIKDISFKYNEYVKNERIADLSSLKINGQEMFQEISASGDTTNSDTGNTRKILTALDQKTFSLFQNFHFISADRLGPIEYVKKKGTSESTQIGIRGEHLINFLAYSGEDIEVVPELSFNNEDCKTLIKQTTNWLAYILDGGDIKIRGTDKDSSILMMMLNSHSDSHYYKQTNVGFGYSYILPLIVVGLIAKQGDIIIIENPEAHLHPRAQSRITEFFAKVASYGVQVFIESHSEHILNGLRVCALNPKSELKHGDLSIHYFDENFKPKKLIFNEKGKIENWPEGFFDQQEIDLGNLFRYSK